MTLLVTGGLGFIGSAVVRAALNRGHTVVNLDARTYAANPANVPEHPRLTDVHGDVCDADTLRELFRGHRFDAVMHLAAESHVDRSIDGPTAFVHTNVTGTARLLEAARDAWIDSGDAVRFLHVSTDEVYGSLGPTGRFDEHSPLVPTSPYAAGKASADMLVSAWHRTYGLPTLVTRCSNNLGPRQNPEKLVPRVILCALTDTPVPVYGDGRQVRDWIHVDDHVRGLFAVLERGRVGEVYNLGGDAERTNLDLIATIGASVYRHTGRSLRTEHIADRPAHDRRYALDAGKASKELGWTPEHDLASAVDATVRWYLEHDAWWRPLIEAHPLDHRLGEPS